MLFSAGCVWHNRFDPARRADQKTAFAEFQELNDGIAAGHSAPVEFVFRTVSLKDSSFQTLDRIADVLKEHPDLKLIVEAHTCEVGGDDLNDRLSRERGAVVRTYLISKGVKPEHVKFYGYGKRRPVTADTPGKDRNRDGRIEFMLTDSFWTVLER